ncbi:MAG: hypothetical protein ABJI96_08000 [Paracoccaceae bacterium]
MSKRTFLAALALVTTAYGANAATLVSLSNFGTDAIVEDFNAAPLGIVQPDNAIFTNLGITGLRSAGYNRDRFNNRANSSRALGVDSNGNLSIIDPGTRGLSSSYSLSFASTTTRFGFGIHDQRTRLNVEFFNNGTLVDQLRVRTRTRDLAQFYIWAAEFDMVKISSRRATQAFALDNLTISPIPVPAGLPLFVTALGAFAWTRRKSKV